MTAGLPRVDEHWIDVAASPERVWAALETLIGAAPGGRCARAYATLVGARERARSPGPLGVGATLVGFRVTRADPPREVVLEGAHRFARYALVLRVAPTDTGARVGAITDADFPGVAGRAYRLLVIGSGGHAALVRSLLGRLKARAEGGAPAAGLRG